MESEIFFNHVHQVRDFQDCQFIQFFYGFTIDLDKSIYYYRIISEMGRNQSCIEHSLLLNC